MPVDGPLRFSPEGRFLYFLGSDDNVWEASLDTGEARPVTDLMGRRGFLEFDLATDGRYLYIAWRDDLGDIWVMDVVP